MVFSMFDFLIVEAYEPEPSDLYGEPAERHFALKTSILHPPRAQNFLGERATPAGYARMLATLASARARAVFLTTCLIVEVVGRGGVFDFLGGAYR